jgi:NTE family protein
MMASWAGRRPAGRKNFQEYEAVASGTPKTMSDQIPGKNAPEESLETSMRKPSVGMVIGSSGVKAFAALPFMQRLMDLELKVDFIFGTGGGGLLATLWSSGYNLDQIAKFFTKYFTKEAFHQVDTSALMQIMNNDGTAYNFATGLYKNSALRKAYNVIFKDMRLEDLKPKTILYATDIATGDLVALERGLIADAVEACSSLYPIMPPVEIEGRRLADGSFLSPLPVIEAVKRNLDIILVVYLQDKLDPEPKNFFESYLNIARIKSTALQRAQLFGSIDLHHFEILIAEVAIGKTIHPWNVDAIPEIMLVGKEAAFERVPELMKIKSNFERKERERVKEALEKAEEEQKKKSEAMRRNVQAGEAYEKNSENTKDSAKIWRI